ncbi:conserved hypothetical protein [Leishmania major strain Friedlin]|uniref:Uncharacterized protein n=1 Tax=Leishmania major TaxID=5664 RepID=E9AE49_LEIMA|nr:conserved hypothetical protein [Leishmania major strain Friedlin]CAG9577928.1 hypothetical_protein_-_conserved [Leishmania major strain Friedlin]CBZ12528.1 conserved hypothetical protein [Leishmania major strain Friedlin]|eukprot:XP_003722270.1 conserved hypothetical protein [Leishmania major strain Friedlin]
MTQATHISDSSPSATAPQPAWTVEQVYAILRKHESLCNRILLLSSAPLSMGLVASPRPAAVETAVESLDTVSHSPHHVSTRRGPRANAAAVRDIRVLLDRLSQAPQRLGALHEKQRRRLVTKVCCLGYAVGLYSRCCALYADTVLLARGVSDGGRNREPGALPESSPSHEHALRSSEALLPTVAVGAPSSVPDFIIDAAGKAADLTTLRLCCPHDAHASPTEASAAASPISVTALHVYAQCVGVLLRHGWGGCLASTATDMGVRTAVADGGVSHESRDADEGIPADPVIISSTAVTRNATTAAAAVASLTTRTPSTIAPAEASGEQAWRDFALTVLRHLRIDDADAADFLHTSLRRASYRYVDTGGDWAAAQSSVYAQIFRYWLAEEEAAANTLLAPQGLPQHDSEVDGAADGERRHISVRTTSSEKLRVSAPVLLTVPALLTLLRTAVVAHQHDIAEWATLCVDACLEEWTRASKVAAAGASKGRQHDGFDTAAHRIAAPLPPMDNPSAQSLPQLDILLAWYLRHLQQSSQRPRAVRWLSRLRRRQPTVPILSSALATLSVAREAARLAGDELNAELAMWCLQLCLGDTTPALSPGHADIFQCLCAYARCGLPNFDMVLQSLRMNQLLAPTPEEALFLRLLHARRSVNWRTEWEHCVAPYIVEEEEGDELKKPDGEGVDVKVNGETQGGVRATRRPPSRRVTLRMVEPAESREGTPSTSPMCTGVDESLEESGGGRVPSSESRVSSTRRHTALSSVFSSRVIYQLLLILQEGEHPAFMSYYRTLLLTFSEHVTPQDRARWVVLALMWAIQLHGSARSEDVVYIAREVEQLTELQRTHTHAATASSLPLSPEVWHSLSRKWTTLYQQYPLSLWHRAAAAGADSGSDTRHGSPLRQLQCTPSSGILATTPALTRFAKRRHLLPSAVVSATELLRTSRRVSAEVTVAGRYSSGDAAVAHWPPQEDVKFELWANYVEAVRRF